MHPPEQPKTLANDVAQRSVAMLGEKAGRGAWRLLVDKLGPQTAAIKKLPQVGRLTATVGRQLVQIESRFVHEVLFNVPEYTPIPRTQPWILGLANVQGDLVTLIDLFRFLFQQPTVLAQGTRVIVIGQPECRVGLIVTTLHWGTSEIASANLTPNKDIQRFFKEESDKILFDIPTLLSDPDFNQPDLKMVRLDSQAEPPILSVSTVAGDIHGS